MTELNPVASLRILKWAANTKNRNEHRNRQMSVWVDAYGATYRVVIPQQGRGMAYIASETHGSTCRPVSTEFDTHIALAGEDKRLREAWGM